MTNSEPAMVTLALRVGAVVAVVAGVVAGLVTDLAGALTAVGAVAFVAAVFAVTGRSLSWAADRGPTTVQAVALGGFFVRLVVYAFLIVLLRPVQAINGTVLAASAGAAMVVILACETRLVLAHREFWFVDAAARPVTGLADRKERA